MAWLFFANMLLAFAAIVPSGAATTYKAVPLTKRVLTVDTNLILRRAQNVAIIVPIPITALQLAAFYSKIYDQCVMDWIVNFPENMESFIIRSAGLELSFVVNENSIHGVPWAFVRDFATTMRALTASGFTGCYDLGYWNAAGTFGVYVGLRIIG